jgi:hypothetical protein
MNRDYEPISVDGRPGPSFRTLFAIIFIAFLAGVILTGWLAARYDLFGLGDGAAASESELATAAPLPVDPQAPLDRPAATEAIDPTPDGLSIRVADLENRLSRINVQAEAASGNAARAEGLLIAFATRRALDQGRPLGYLDEQLQLRFGLAQPDAVRALRRFAADPVVLERLQSRLDEMGDVLTSSGEFGLFDQITREVRELFLVRTEGTPSTASAARLTRARRFVEAGNVEAAIAEIEKLPGAEKADAWLADARRYQEAQEALEVLEMAAIFEPRQLRDTYGDEVRQPSPLPAGEADPAPPEASQSSPEAPAPAAGQAEENENFFGF